MNTNFYYGSFISISDNDASHIRAGNIFWVNDGTTANRHPYLIANSYMHEKNAVICAWVIDSKPYSSDMVPFTMNNGISYVNPFKMVMFKSRDIRREYYHGTISDDVFDIVFDMYSLMFNRRGSDEIISRYENYVKRFFDTYSEPAIEQIMMTENSLAFQSSIIDFNVLDFLGIDPDRQNLDNFEVSENEVREYYAEISNKDTNSTNFLDDNISDEDKILFIGLKKLYKIKEICAAANISNSTYYNRVEEFKTTIGIGEVLVKLENGTVK